MGKLSIDREFYIPEIEKLLDIGCQMMDLSDEIGRDMAEGAREVSRAIAALPAEAQLPEAKAAADHLAATAHRPQFLECKAMMQRNLGRIIDEVPRLDQEMAARVNELTQKTEVMILKVQSVRQMVGNDSPLITYDGFKKQLADSLARCELEELKRFVHFDKDVVEYNWKEIEEALKQESLTEKEKQALVQVLFSIGEKETEESLRDMEKFLEACYVYRSNYEMNSLESKTYVLSEHFDDIVQLYEAAILDGSVSDLQIRYKDIMKELPKSLFSRENKDFDAVMEGEKPKVMLEINDLYGIPCLNASIQMKDLMKKGIIFVTYENVVGEKWSWDGVLNPELGELLTVTKDGFDYDWNGFNEWMGKENLTHRELNALSALVYSIGEHEAEQTDRLLGDFISQSFTYQAPEGGWVRSSAYELSPHFEDIVNQYKDYVIQNDLLDTLHKHYSDFLEVSNYFLTSVSLDAPGNGLYVEWIKPGNGRDFLQMQVSVLMSEGVQDKGITPVRDFFVISGNTVDTLQEYIEDIMSGNIKSDLISVDSVFEYGIGEMIGKIPEISKAVPYGKDVVDMLVGHEDAKQNFAINEFGKLVNRLQLNGTLVVSESRISLLEYEIGDFSYSIEKMNSTLDKVDKLEELGSLTECEINDYIDSYFLGKTDIDRTVEELEKIRKKVEISCNFQGSNLND